MGKIIKHNQRAPILCKKLNIDTLSYSFEDIDLRDMVKRLSTNDQKVLILHLMGHTQDDIAILFNVTRSMISKRLNRIIKKLSRWMK